MFELLFVILSIVVIEPYFKEYYIEYENLLNYIFVCHLYLYGILLLLERIFKDTQDKLFCLVLCISFTFSLLKHLFLCYYIGVPLYVYPSIVYLTFLSVFIMNMVFVKILKYFFIMMMSLIEMVCKKRTQSEVELFENGIDKTPPKNICGICYEPSHLYFLDCGHVVCKDCGLKVLNVCPYCRTYFKQMKRIYFP